jgi:hypothetical protein
MDLLVIFLIRPAIDRKERRRLTLRVSRIRVTPPVALELDSMESCHDDFQARSF